MTDKISVVLCTHNGADYILEQVGSICAQTILPDEVIISDDASSDNTIDIVVEQFTKHVNGKMLNLKILRNNIALGVAKNFEQAIDACSGQLVALCDQDDVWLPHRLERMIYEFTRRPSLLLLHSDARLVNAHGQSMGYTLFQALDVRRQELERLHGGRALEVYIRRNLATGATTMFRRSLFTAAFPFPQAWLHDEWLAAIASTVGMVDVLEEKLILYRQHDRNVIGARRLGMLENIQRVLTPRGDTHIKQAEKITTWLDRIDKLSSLGFGINSDAQLNVFRRLGHCRFRATLPTNRLRRIWPVFCEAYKGGYFRFGRGFRGILRDLIEPA